jgi:hypothetical protein
MSFLNRGPRGTLGLTALATLLGLAGKHINPDSGDIGESREPSLAGLNRYRPHQSTRECARRIGGERWRFVKMADRARRGLPAEV